MTGDETAARVAVVTGAGSGMGRACVDRLLPVFDVVIAADLTKPDIEGALGVAVDVADPNANERLAGQVRAAGRLGALVHAAGISPTMAEARRILEVDLIGTQLVLNAFDDLVCMGSAAVCFSSSAAYVLASYVTPDLETLLRDPMDPDFLDRAVEAMGGDRGLSYALAKIGVIRAAGRAAVTWGRRGGRVNSLAPGLIDTPMGRQELAGQPAMRDMLAQVPLQRLGQPDEIATVVAFLVSEAASYINGVDVLVDGGQGRGAEAAAAIGDASQ